MSRFLWPIFFIIIGLLVMIYGLCAPTSDNFGDLFVILGIVWIGIGGAVILWLKFGDAWEGK